MSKRIALLATAAALAAMPALAQQPTTPGAPSPSPQTAPQAQQAETKQFVESQSSDQWLASKLIGLRVSSGDENIGSINNLLIDPDGKIVAAVIGVGGFLGIGQKEVAVSMSALNLSRDPDGSEKATVKMTKAELEGAPDFKAYQPPRPVQQRPERPGGAPGMPGAPGGGR